MLWINDLGDFLNITFILIVAFLFLLAWSIGGFLSYRVGQKAKSERPQIKTQPVLRLADQWLLESQGKIQALILRAEQPLSTAQHELLDLRLEAGRLPQGNKSLKMARESLLGPARVNSTDKKLRDLISLYLDESSYGMGEEGVLFLKTSMGDMPCVEVSSDGETLTEAQMKVVIGQAVRALAAAGKGKVTGGFVYFGREADFKICLEKAEWLEGLRQKSLVAMDQAGLIALLSSLRLSNDVDRLVKVFEEGVRSTEVLVGQADRMGAALSRLSSDSLKVRNILDGGTPSVFDPSDPKNL